VRAASESSRPASTTRLRHDAYFYDDAERYVADVLRFVRDGLARDEPVLVAVPDTHLEHLRAGLSPAEAGRVRLCDMAVAGRNPGRLLGSLFGAFVGAHAEGGVRIVSEVLWPERTDEEYPACVEHEALVNVALADAAAHVLCPYDAARLPPFVISDATRTHPGLIQDGAQCGSPSYADPRATAASFDRPLTPPPDEAEIVVVNTITGPRTVRRVAYRFGERAGLPPDRLDDLTITVHELAVNTILHGGGAGLMSVWAADHHVVVQIDDGGHIADPLVGRRPPGPFEIGHGLAVVHQVADLVRVHRTGEGTTVRAWFRFGRGQESVTPA
jgi:anti-sigma regulatory factor (Ser/Thr protein kinase)